MVKVVKADLQKKQLDYMLAGEEPGEKKQGAVKTQGEPRGDAGNRSRKTGRTGNKPGSAAKSRSGGKKFSGAASKKKGRR